LGRRDPDRLRLAFGTAMAEPIHSKLAGNKKTYFPFIWKQP
jgi:hypothetical protein